MHAIGNKQSRDLMVFNKIHKYRSKEGDTIGIFVPFSSFFVHSVLFVGFIKIMNWTLINNGRTDTIRQNPLELHDKCFKWRSGQLWSSRQHVESQSCQANPSSAIGGLHFEAVGCGHWKWSLVPLSLNWPNCWLTVVVRSWPTLATTAVARCPVRHANTVSFSSWATLKCHCVSSP